MQPPIVTILAVELADDDASGSDAAFARRRARLAALRATVAQHEGRELRPTGDGLVAVFASAVAALRCAAAAQRAAAEEGRALRIGLETGEPQAGDDELHGDAVTVAERLCDHADAGQILATDVVRRIAAARAGLVLVPAGAARLRGIAEAVATAQVQWRDEPPAGPPVAPDAVARPITVVIADDQQLVRAGFRVILEAERDITVIGEAGDGRTAVDVVARRRPDVVLMDIRMPELDGLAAAERILADPAGTAAVLMLTTFDSSEFVFRALRAGAAGFLLKDTPADRLIDAVRVAAAGDALIAPSITRRLIGEFVRAARPAGDELPEALRPLTARELDVLRLVARGLSNAEIAAELVLGESTIKTHVARLLSKLGLRDRVQAVVLAYETGLIVPDG